MSRMTSQESTSSTYTTSTYTTSCYTSSEEDDEFDVDFLDTLLSSCTENTNNDNDTMTTASTNTNTMVPYDVHYKYLIHQLPQVPSIPYHMIYPTNDEEDMMLLDALLNF